MQLNENQLQFLSLNMKKEMDGKITLFSLFSIVRINALGDSQVIGIWHFSNEMSYLISVSQ